MSQRETDPLPFSPLVIPFDFFTKGEKPSPLILAKPAPSVSSPKVRNGPGKDKSFIFSVQERRNEKKKKVPLLKKNKWSSLFYFRKKIYEFRNLFSIDSSLFYFGGRSTGNRPIGLSEWKPVILLSCAMNKKFCSSIYTFSTNQSVASYSNL